MLNSNKLYDPPREIHVTDLGHWSIWETKCNKFKICKLTKAISIDSIFLNVLGDKSRFHVCHNN